MKVDSSLYARQNSFGYLKQGFSIAFSLCAT
jgi:hypothetical protein